MADFCHSLMQFSSVVIGNTQLFVQSWAVTLVAALSTAHIGVTTPCSHNPQQVRPNCKQERVCGLTAVHLAALSTVWSNHALSHKIVYPLTNSILRIACHHCKTCVCLTKYSEAFYPLGQLYGKSWNHLSFFKMGADGMKLRLEAKGTWFSQ